MNKVILYMLYTHTHTHAFCKIKRDDDLVQSMNFV